MKFPIYKYLNSSAVHLFLLASISIIVSTKGIGIGETWWSDASQHAMNGVYLLDLIKNLPLNHIYDYTISYYFRYPALTLGFHPPFFPIVEAIFFSIGGISILTAKFTVILFVIIGTIFWYRLIALIYNQQIAFFASIFLFTSPIIVIWSREVMLEIPALTMVIISVYFFYIYIELSRPKYAYFLTCSIVLAILTKQTSIFIVPLFISYIILTKKIRRLFNKETLISGIFFLLCITLTIVLTLLAGKNALAHVTLSMDKIYGFSKISFDNLIYYVQCLPEALSFPVLIISSLSIIFFLIKKHDKATIIFILWIVIDYLIITFISVKEARYLIFLIPPFSLLATLILFELRIKIKKVTLSLIIALILSAFQTVKAYTFEHPVISGYETAAKYIAENSKGFGILVNAYYNSNFVFFFRKYDTQKNNIILRGDKLVYQYYNGNNCDSTSLLKMFADYGIKYIVVESFKSDMIPQLEIIKPILRSNYFILLKEIPIKTNIKEYKNTSIFIYEYNGDFQINQRFLTYDIWLAGKTIKYPIEHLLKNDKKLNH